MAPFTIAAARAIAETKAARYIAGTLTFALCLWIATCQGERHQVASDRIRLDDSVRAISAAETNAADAERRRDSITAAGFAAALSAIQDTAHAAARRATALADRLSVVTVGTIKIVHPSDSASAPRPGLGAADDPPDTTRYTGIQRQGDARVYTVPQFVVDVGTALRDALTKSQAAEAQAAAAIAAKDRVIADDAVAISARDRSIAAFSDEVKTLKSSAGRDCRILFFPCPTRTIVALGGMLLGSVAGYELAKR